MTSQPQPLSRKVEAATSLSDTFPIAVPPRSQQTLLLAVALICLACYMVSSPRSFFANGDSTWHVAAGQHIIEARAVPATDPWSFTTGETSWFNLAWLYDVLAALVHDAGGVGLVVAVHALVAAVLVIIVARHCLVRGFGPIPTVLASLLLMIGLMPSVSVRPQLISLLFLAVFYTALARKRDGAKSRIWPLLLVSLLWVNMHGGFIAVFPLLGAFALEALVTRRRDLLQFTVVLGVFVAIAALATPFGVDTYLGVWRTLHGVAVPFISEWQPASIRRTPELFAIFLILAALGPLSLRPLPVAEIVLSGFWFVMALLSLRYASLFALFATPLMAASLHRALSRSPFAQGYRTRSADCGRDFSQPIALTLLGAAGLLFAATVVVPSARRLLWERAGASPEQHPVKEIAFLMDNHPNARVFNDFGYGGLIIYRSKGTLKLFIDGRESTAYPTRVILDQHAIANFDNGWETLLDDYQVDAILLANSAPHAYLLDRSPTWKKLFRGPVAGVWVRSR